MAVLGFGGMLPMARRVVVDERRWLSEDEFTELYSICVFLPGGSVINAAVMVGYQFQGWRGSGAAMLGLLVVPIPIVLGLALAYQAFGSIEALGGALSGVAAATAGVFFATGVRLAEPLARRDASRNLAVLAAVFCAIGLLGLSLPLVAVCGFLVSLTWYLLGR